MRVILGNWSITKRGFCPADSCHMDFSKRPSEHRKLLRNYPIVGAFSCCSLLTYVCVWLTHSGRNCHIRGAVGQRNGTISYIKNSVVSCFGWVFWVFLTEDLIPKTICNKTWLYQLLHLCLLEFFRDENLNTKYFLDFSQDDVLTFEGKKYLESFCLCTCPFQCSRVGLSALMGRGKQLLRCPLLVGIRGCRVNLGFTLAL